MTTAGYLPSAVSAVPIIHLQVKEKVLQLPAPSQSCAYSMLHLGQSLARKDSCNVLSCFASDPGCRGNSRQEMISCASVQEQASVRSGVAVGLLVIWMHGTTGGSRVLLWTCTSPEWQIDRHEGTSGTQTYGKPCDAPQQGVKLRGLLRDRA